MADHYYNLDWTALERDTLTLNIEQIGALIVFMNKMRALQAKLPDDIDFLKNLWRVHANKARALRLALLANGNLVEEDGYLFNRRCVRDIAERQQLAAKRRDAADKRWTSGRETTRKRSGPGGDIPPNPLETKDADAALAHIREERRVERVKEEAPETLPERSSKRNRFVTADAATLPFDQFWAVYPNKVGKGDARAKFAKALKKTSLEAILAGLERYRAKRDDRPWCNPATWLHQERWLDETNVVPLKAPAPGLTMRAARAT